MATVPQLREKAESLGLNIVGRPKKADLEALIREHQQGPNGAQAPQPRPPEIAVRPTGFYLAGTAYVERDGVCLRKEVPMQQKVFSNKDELIAWLLNPEGYDGEFAEFSHAVREFVLNPEG